MAKTVWRTGAWRLQIVKRSDAPGFEVLPKRWIVERTFAWISRNRRLARDFEHYAATAAALTVKEARDEGTDQIGVMLLNAEIAYDQQHD